MWIDHDGILHGILNEDGIGDGDLIFGKAKVDPVGNKQIVSKDVSYLIGLIYLQIGLFGLLYKLLKIDLSELT